MPTYDFKCIECGFMFSKFVSIKERENIRCPECKGKVKQRFTSLNFIGCDSSCSCSGSNCNNCSGCH
ncbi:MAG TPA: zinc ribbon domain-containing protein [Thermoanaerobacterales bacterium]|jgi:putative FmdB family regulatory protein|nr:zinc ribbon domain-containing protein [Thermoanaerobacterales bacterium]